MPSPYYITKWLSYKNAQDDLENIDLPTTKSLSSL